METINPYAPPKSEVAQIDQNIDIWCDGKYVLFDKSIENFPPRCICCGAPAAPPLRRRHLRWVNPWWYLILIISVFGALLIALLVLLCVQKRAKVRLGMCATHRRARNRRCLQAWGGSIALLVMAGILLGLVDMFIFLPPVCLLCIGGAAYWMRFPMSVVRFEGDIVRAKGCGEGFLQTLSVYDRR